MTALHMSVGDLLTALKDLDLNTPVYIGKEEETLEEVSIIRELNPKGEKEEYVLLTTKS